MDTKKAIEDFKTIFNEEKTVGNFHIELNGLFNVELKEKNFIHPILKDKFPLMDQQWTAVIDPEVECMNKSMTNPDVKGHILIGGLGLGIVVYLAKLNPEVTKITVVEKSKDVIDLIKSYNPPFLEDVEIINEDLNKYESGTMYDYFYNDVFVEFAKPDRAYLREKRIMERFKREGKVKYKTSGFWLEDFKEYRKNTEEYLIKNSKAHPIKHKCKKCDEVNN